MELTGLKQIKNGIIPMEKPTIEEKVASGIGVEGTTGLSTLADRKYIKNLPKFEYGKPQMNTQQIMQANSKPLTLSVNTSPTLSGGSFGNGTTYNPLQTRINTNDPSKFFDLKIGISNPSTSSKGSSGGGGNNLGKTLGNIASTAVPYAGALMLNATMAIDLVGGIASAGKYNKSADDLLQESGTAEGNIGGVLYQTQNEIDALKVSAQNSAESKANTMGLMGTGAALGASLGMVAGPVGSLVGGAIGAVGGLIGGLFGSSKRKREMRRRVAEAQDKALRQNDFSRNGALTSVLQLNYAREYGDTESQSLYGFANGKPTWSAAGSVGLGANARVSNGEIIANKYTGEMFRVPGLPNNKDGKLAFIRPSDTIISNKYGLSDYVASTGDLEGGEAMQGMIMKSLGKKGYKNGKLPGFAWGLPEWLNMATNAIGLINAGVDYNKINNEPISTPNTRTTNSYATPALNTMAAQRFNPYSAQKEMWDVQGKRTNAIRNNAGMSAAQRAVAEYAGYNDVMNSMAKLNQYGQEMNSKYAQAYAQMAAQLGSEQANRDMQSAQFDYNAYNQAHGARTLMASQRQADMMNYLNNFTKGMIDMHNWRKMYKLYEEDVKNRKNNNSNTANTVKSWGDIYNDMGINKTADYADTTSDAEWDAAWTKRFRKKFSPAPLSDEEIYARNIKNLGLNSLFYNPPMPEKYINPLKYISTRRSNKRKNKKS